MTDADMDKARAIAHTPMTCRYVWLASREAQQHSRSCTRLATLIAAAIKAEREACAALADIRAEFGTLYRGDRAGRNIANAIRARGGVDQG